MPAWDSGVQLLGAYRALVALLFSMNVFSTSFNILNSIYDAMLESLFPLHPAERWLLSMSVEGIARELPRSKHSSIPESFAVFSYKDERVQHLIWAIKYKKLAKAAEVAGASLGKYLQQFSMIKELPGDGIMPKIIVVPMPVSKQRRRERGFNQCELITNFLPSDKSIITECNLLIRQKHTSRQTLKDKTEREEMHDIFAIVEKVAVSLSKDYIIIIIDDVVTTGATMKAAVSCLRTAGFANTWGLSVAH